MRNRSVEFSVGVFVLIGLICVAYLTVKLGKMELFGGGYYTVTARFQSVSGLKKDAVIDMAGVQIGHVESIELDKVEMMAVVSMKIKQGVSISDDSIASVKTSGLIGDKYIRISPGGSSVSLKDGDKIIDTESAVDLEEIIGKYAFGKV